MRDLEKIRNFCIIAHIDHGKSTLADRLIEKCGGLSAREMSSQVLDSLDIERERGITIKAQSVTLFYISKKDNIKYQLNLIDTPGHVDFCYEVSRSLAACEGALLVVDASQGVEAQTVSVCHMAANQNLEILPVLNKIDLPQSNPEKVIAEIEDIIGIEAQDSLAISAKTGLNIDLLLELIIEKIPCPKTETDQPLQALIIDSWFDNYWGVVSLVRIKNGCLKLHDKILIYSTHKVYTVEQLGIFTPKKQERDRLNTGEVGYVIANIKDIFGAPVGDTLTLANQPCMQPLPGFAKAKSQVFAGLFPLETSQYENFREALEKLRLNDASLSYEPETSEALGFGFRCGFLGMLHMEIIQERLEREYQLELITTAPTVIYEIIDNDNNILKIDNPAKLPPPNKILAFREPIAEVNILVPESYLGAVITLCAARRGIQKKLIYCGSQISLGYEIPLNEIVLDFFDRLKSVTRGYASLDYQLSYFREDDLVKLDILINSDRIDALSLIVHRSHIVRKGRAMAEKLRTLIPRQMFDVAIQAAIGNQIVARTTVKAFRKNVIAKCYGGDITRKRKLLEKQKKGKARMKQIGQVEVPQEAFWAMLKVDED